MTNLEQDSCDFDLTVEETVIEDRIERVEELLDRYHGGDPEVDSTTLANELQWAIHNLKMIVENG